VVKENQSVYDAISSMFLGDVGTLFVVDEAGYLSGVLSRKDLLRASIGNQDLNAVPVHIIMTRMPNITVCKPNDLLIEAGNQVIGRITKTNITKAFVELILDEQV